MSFFVDKGKSATSVKFGSLGMNGAPGDRFFFLERLQELCESVYVFLFFFVMFFCFLFFCGMWYFWVFCW